MNAKYIQDATEAIRETVCQTMPTVAAANGLIDPLPTRADAAAILDGPHGAALTAQVGLTRLTEELYRVGLPCSKAMARAVREEIIRRDMASAN